MQIAVRSALEALNRAIKILGEITFIKIKASLALFDKSNPTPAAGSFGSPWVRNKFPDKSSLLLVVCISVIPRMSREGWFLIAAL